MSAAAARAAPARGPEFGFGPADHAAIAKLVYAEAGIVLPAGKSQLVYGRLAKRVRTRGLDCFADYIALLDSDAAERGLAIDALTTNHTKFFREDHHFDHFTAEVWPRLNRTVEEGGRVRLWSAACSSGEEPYTWLMALLGDERGGAARLGKRDFRMLATDLSDKVLKMAAAGRYPQSVADGIPAALRNAWTRRVGDEFEIDPAMRALVAYKSLNLLRPWPMKGQFDAIFCRNVMIYFDEPTKAELQANLADRLVPGGFMYIGHSERIAPSLASTLRCIGRTIYQKVDA